MCVCCTHLHRIGVNSFTQITGKYTDNLTRKIKTYFRELGMSSLKVLYGSETGTAEDVAEKVCSQLAAAGVQSAMQALDDADFASIFAENGSPDTIVFVVSTTGDGKVPSNMRYFWRYLLQKKLQPGCLRNLRFAIFGLGDSSYDKYNAAAR